MHPVWLSARAQNMPAHLCRMFWKLTVALFDGPWWLWPETCCSLQDGHTEGPGDVTSPAASTGSLQPRLPSLPRARRCPQAPSPAQAPSVLGRTVAVSTSVRESLWGRAIWSPVVTQGLGQWASGRHSSGLTQPPPPPPRSCSAPRAGLAGVSGSPGIETPVTTASRTGGRGPGTRDPMAGSLSSCWPPGHCPPGQGLRHMAGGL